LNTHIFQSFFVALLILFQKYQIMCIVFIGVNVHPRYKLVIAANRDEFIDRPTDVADYWKDHPHILAGRDVERGGTWLGINWSSFPLVVFAFSRLWCS
jgi:hypothetical protein